MIKILLSRRLAALFLAVLGIFFDIFIIDSSSDLRILFLIGLWILSIRLHKFEAQVTMVIGLALLALCPFALIFSRSSVAEKAAIWAYLFLIVGVIQELVTRRPFEFPPRSGDYA